MMGRPFACGPSVCCERETLYRGYGPGWAGLGGSIFSFCERNSWFVLELLAKRHVRHAHAKKTTDYMCYICRIHVVVSNI